MIVDQSDGAPGGQHTVNASATRLIGTRLANVISEPQIAKRKMDMLFVRGDGVILVCATPLDRRRY